MTLMGSSVEGTWTRKESWAWRHINSNSLSWNAMPEKKKKKRRRRIGRGKHNRTSKNCETVSYIIGVSEEKKEQSRRNTWSDNIQEFPKLMTYTKPQIQEAQRMPCGINIKSVPTHIIIKLQKTKHKEKILKISQRKKLTCI